MRCSAQRKPTVVEAETEIEETEEDGFLDDEEDDDGFFGEGEEDEDVLGLETDDGMPGINTGVLSWSPWHQLAASSVHCVVH